jgi:16S rRNA (cytosine967-C5)-methyltransferase
MSKISPARAAAFEILRRIEKERAFSSVLLPLYEEKLGDKDRALCHQIVLGVLRKKLYLDRVIDLFANGRKIDASIRTILEMGLFQLFFLDKIPAYSAINEAVNLAVKAKKTSAKGFVNAVLRRATRERPELKFKSETEKIAVETSHPEWLVEKWAMRFGREKAFALAAANNELPPLAFRPTGLFSGGEAFPAENYRKSEFVENCFIAERADERLLQMAEAGEIYFQDEASQMVGQTVGLKPGKSFLDVCAAPGGKTTQIALGIKNAKLKIKNSDSHNSQPETRNSQLTAHSSQLISGDVHSQRVKFLRDNCRRQGVDFVSVVQYDAENSLPFADESFDRVLLDAPCSGTGTIRHNPEIRYFLREDDFEELSGKQLRILENASKLVKRGGKLIYSTCSLEREENESVIENFLSGGAGFRPAAPPVPERFLTGEGFARTFPSTDDMDGFFISVLVRI